MILFRKEPYHLQMRNIMLLDDNMLGGVIYVSKSTYDQALMLSSRVDGDYNRIVQILRGKGTDLYVTVPGLPALIDKMAKGMPEPINILAPFLMFCSTNKGIDWNADNAVEMSYGILHQYSQMIDFNAMTLVPSEVRANVTFPTTLLLQYETSWDELCSTLKDRVVEIATPIQQVAFPVQQVTAPTQATQNNTPTTTQTTPIQPESKPTPAEQPEEEENPIVAKLRAAVEKSKKDHEALLKKEAEANKARKEKKEEKSKPVVSKPSASEAAEANAVLDEFDGF